MYIIKKMTLKELKIEVVYIKWYFIIAISLYNLYLYFDLRYGCIYEEGSA